MEQKEQLNNQKFLDSFENNKQDYNNDKLHSGEGDAQQLSLDNNCPVDLELKSNNNHYTSNKVSHFSKTHKCGTCLALEQRKQKFRSVKTGIFLRHRTQKPQLSKFRYGKWNG